MVSKQLVLGICVFVLMVMTLPTAVMADEWNKATQLTFNEPVEVPGAVLTPGTYWFTLADSDSDRNIVDIWNADRTHLIRTILAIPDYRLKPTGKLSFISRSVRPTRLKRSIPGSIRVTTTARSSFTRCPERLSWPNRRTVPCSLCASRCRRNRNKSNRLQ
jgi:hypothetical protein